MGSSLCHAKQDLPPALITVAEASKDNIDDVDSVNFNICLLENMAMKPSPKLPRREVTMMMCPGMKGVETKPSIGKERPKTAIYNSMVDKLKCNVCKDSYSTKEEDRKPKTIPCGHTVCSECLTFQIETAISQHFFSCPICDRRIECPTNGVDDFTTNNDMLEMVKFNEDLATHANPTCRVHNTSISHACIPCGSPLCSNCLAEAIR